MARRATRDHSNAWNTPWSNAASHIEPPLLPVPLTSSPALIAALSFTGLLLVTTLYFIMGSVPLLVLKHDTPLDSRFIRSFLNVYCQAAIFIAGATAVSYAWAGSLGFAAGAAALALSTLMLRGKVVRKMGSLSAQIEVDGASAIPTFRRMHAAAVLIMLAQLALVVWGLIAVSLSLR